jgi:hypothetical protein
MKILRSVNRRGFSVGTAGWFTVLRPNTWFPASRLPGKFHYPRGRSNGAAELDGRETTVRFQAMTLGVRDRRLMRPALIVLAAIAITSVLLWWIMHP